MFKVNKNAIMRYAVPFYFEEGDNEYQLICEKLINDKEDWFVATTEKGERDTYEYLYEALGCDYTDNQIGSEWQYNLSKNSMDFIYYPNPKEQELYYKFKIRDMGMYLFKTNIGILWYEISLPYLPKQLKQTNNRDLLDDSFLMVFQNRFKELNYRHNKYFKVEPKTGEKETLIMGDIIKNLLNEISDNIHFIGGQRRSNGEMYPDKALIFNYLLLESDKFVDKEFRKRAFSFANGYNENYKMAEDLNEAFSSTFDKTCWYASKSGCGYFTYKAQQEKNEFFENGLASRIRGDYFFMYILALYQSYSLLNYLREIMQNYPAESEKYFEVEHCEKLEKLTARINAFLIKGIYSSVSNVHHHNKFFMFLQKQLNIQEDIESITMGINAMVKMQSIYKEKQAAQVKEQEEKRENKHNNQVNMILTIISTLSVFSALVDMNELMNRVRSACGTQGFLKEVWSLLASGDIIVYFQLIFGALLVGLSLACIYVLIKNFIGNKKKNDK